MNKRIFIATILAATLAAAGCASHQGPKEQVGTVAGGVIGGLAGHQVGSGSGKTAATIVGALAGAAIGSSVGRNMDERDRVQMARTFETSRTGATNRWENPDTGRKYAVTPTRTYESSSGPCREYTMDAWVGGNREEVHGTACRQPDGSWKIVD